MMDWLLSLALLIGSLLILPRLLRRSKTASRSLGGSGIMVAFGMAFAMIFDPKAVQATEQIQKQNDLGDQDESGRGGSSAADRID